MISKTHDQHNQKASSCLMTYLMSPLSPQAFRIHINHIIIVIILTHILIATIVMINIINIARGTTDPGY